MTSFSTFLVYFDLQRRQRLIRGDPNGNSSLKNLKPDLQALRLVEATDVHCIWITPRITKFPRLTHVLTFPLMMKKVYFPFHLSITSFDRSTFKPYVCESYLAHFYPTFMNYEYYV